MSDAVQRTEILEERANRDALRLAWGLLFLHALFLAGLLYAIAHMNVVSFSLQPKPATPKAQHAPLNFSTSATRQPESEQLTFNASHRSVVRVLRGDLFGVGIAPVANQPAGPRALRAPEFPPFSPAKPNGSTLPAGCVIFAL